MIARTRNGKRVSDKRKKDWIGIKRFCSFYCPKYKTQKNEFYSVSQIQVVIHWGTIQQSWESLVESNE